MVVAGFGGCVDVGFSERNEDSVDFYGVDELGVSVGGDANADLSEDGASDGEKLLRI